MSRLVLPATLLSHLRGTLLEHSDESCAVLFGHSIDVHGFGLTRIIAREAVIAPPESYARRSELAVQLKPSFVAGVAKRARRLGETLVFVHTHPFGYNKFSSTDDAGEAELAEFLESRGLGSAHGALLITPETQIGRQLGTKQSLTVIGVGPVVSFSSAETSADVIPNDLYDRQVRVMGRAAQRQLAHLRIGIVGLGGTGSLVAQQLAHLGVGSFVLMDPDVVATSNLNRLVGATSVDVDRAKVEVTRDLILGINAEAQILALKEDVLRTSSARKLTAVDLLFCCTDSHGSRAVINQLAYQYLIPTIDMGVVITMLDRKIDRIAGRLQMLAPDLACLTCGNLLDPEEVRRDLLSEFERKADPYIPGQLEPAPAVISLNGTVSSLAVTMFLQAIAAMPGQTRFINYDAMLGTARRVVPSRNPICVVCSQSGGLGRGDEWPLAARPQ